MSQVVSHLMPSSMLMMICLNNSNRSWLIHGTIYLLSSLLVLSVLLLKNALNYPKDTGNFRAIAGSWILLKLFGKIVLLLWGHLLTSDTLQFSYNVGTSTTQSSLRWSTISFWVGPTPSWHCWIEARLLTTMMPVSKGLSSSPRAVTSGRPSALPALLRSCRVFSSLLAYPGTDNNLSIVMVINQEIHQLSLW